MSDAEPKTPPPDKLDTILANFDKFEERHEKFEDRHEALEDRVEAVENGQRTIVDQQKSIVDQIEKLATQMRQTIATSAAVERSANAAFELARRALAEMDAAKDATEKMVQSAMAINQDQIASAVRDSLKPLSEEVAKLKTTATSVKTETSAQSTELTTQTSMLDELKKSKRVDRLLIILAGIGSVVTWLISQGHH